MKVSVVLCTYAESMYEEFREAAESILDQSYGDVELIIVVDGTDAVYDRVKADYEARDDVIIHCNEENVGLLESRNNGTKLATGDVVAFIDDDAVADKHWIEELVRSYEEQDAIAVGGKMIGEWVAGKPRFLPKEFYWLVGVTHRGFADEPSYIRNTFGSNISFRRDVFLNLGGFNTEIGGRKGEKNLQGGETELCARLDDEYGERVWYNPNAMVAHKVFDYRTDPKWLLDRAFWQGYSKRAMESLIPESSSEESEFLRLVITGFAPVHAKELAKKRSIAKLMEFVMLFVFTFLVGFGYLYGTWKWKDDTLFS